MHKTATLLGLASAVSSAAAHYNFEKLVVNGEVVDSEPYQYVRQTKNGNGPILDVNSTDIICNNGGIDDDIMDQTETYTVSPGDQVGFNMNEYIGHPGPLAVYMSQAPDTAQAYKGDGEWFKVYEATTRNLTADPILWAPFTDDGGVRNFTFTLPDDLPPGEYLMRGESIALHSAGDVGGAQFYMGCAQLRVDGDGAGDPGPTVNFPGAYTGYEPGILIDLYWPPLRNYTAPGPDAWPNACEDHTINFYDQPTDGDCTPLPPGAEGDDADDDDDA